MKILKTRVKCCHFNNSTYGEIPIGRFPSFEVIFSPEIIWSILFLGVVASMLCFLLWNWVMRKLGAVVATNWVYFNPVTTIFFAWWLLNEQITPWFLLGTILILSGMYLCSRTS